MLSFSSPQMIFLPGPGPLILPHPLNQPAAVVAASTVKTLAAMGVG